MFRQLVSNHVWRASTRRTSRKRIFTRDGGSATSAASTTSRAARKMAKRQPRTRRDRPDEDRERGPRAPARKSGARAFDCVGGCLCFFVLIGALMGVGAWFMERQHRIGLALASQLREAGTDDEASVKYSSGHPAAREQRATVLNITVRLSEIANALNDGRPIPGYDAETIDVEPSTSGCLGEPGNEQLGYDPCRNGDGHR
jgi:hypothetical protein